MLKLNKECQGHEAILNFCKNERRKKMSLANGLICGWGLNYSQTWYSKCKRIDGMVENAEKTMTAALLTGAIAATVFQAPKMSVPLMPPNVKTVVEQGNGIKTEVLKTAVNTVAKVNKTAKVNTALNTVVGTAEEIKQTAKVNTAMKGVANTAEEIKQTAEVKTAMKGVANTTIEIKQTAEVNIAAKLKPTETQMATNTEAEMTTTAIVNEAEIATNTNAEAKLTGETLHGVTIKSYQVTDEFMHEHAEKRGQVYIPTKEEFVVLCKVIYAEAWGESFGGKVSAGTALVNRAIQYKTDIITEAKKPSKFASINGITESMITDEIREAARWACEMDITEGTLKAIAEMYGYSSSYYEGGAIYFFNPEGCGREALKDRENTRGFKIGGHIIYKETDTGLKNKI